MKALFFDIDGTLFEPGKPGVSAAVVEAIQRVQSLGHLCFVSSGRPYTALPTFLDGIDFDGYICGNGTQIATKEGLITEDELKRKQDDVQKLTDKYIAKVEEAIKEKEKQIMEF